MQLSAYRDLQKDATHSEFIRRNARLEAESLKQKEREALRNGVENLVDSKAQKSLKTKVKEAILNAQVERNQEDNWELPMNTNTTTDNVDDWDLLQKLAQ